MTSIEQLRLDVVMCSLKLNGNRFDLEALKLKYTHFSIAVELDGSVFVWVGNDLPVDSVRDSNGWAFVDEINHEMLDVAMGECIGMPGTVPGINSHNWREYCFRIQ